MQVNVYSTCNVRNVSKCNELVTLRAFVKCNIDWQLLNQIKNTTELSCTQIYVQTRVKYIYIYIYLYIQTWVQPLGGGQGAMPPPPLQFPNQTRSNSFSFKHWGYCFLRVFRNYMDQTFTVLCYNIWTIYGGFSFFLTIQGK